LTKLHEVIQIAMGWHFSHLWGFDIEGEQFRTARRVLTNISEVPSEVLGMAEQLSTLDVRPQ
jgi:hypothetical protein